MNLLCLTQVKIDIITTNVPRRVAFECSLGIVSLSRAKFINLPGEGLWPHFARNRFKMFNETIAPGAPNENIVENHLNIALLNVF